MDESALSRIEQQRTELEANIAKLRKSLRHWQTLEIDYESLKEEFFGLSVGTSAELCLEVARDAKLELVDDKELHTLLKDNSGHPRQPAQIVDLLSKRVEYVDRNVQTVRKQLSDAEKRRNALLLAEEPDHRDDAGLPLAEITEELDESGQVLSGKVDMPGSSAPQLLDVLKKAGVTDLKETNGTITHAESMDPSQVDRVGAEESVQNDSSNVTAAADALQMVDVPTSTDDTEEEAQLRKEMLEYAQGMDEVGAIVAELDLEEDGSDVSYDDQDDAFEFDSDMEYHDDVEEDESEDDTGKSKNRLTVPRGYRKKMEELQEKLGLKNLGPESETAVIGQQSRPSAAEAARKAALARHDQSTKSSLKSTLANDDTTAKPRTGKKKVAFASELDIAPSEPSSSARSNAETSREDSTNNPTVRPINDSVVERQPQTEDAPAPDAAPVAPRKQSRFKSTRQVQPPAPLSAPNMSVPLADVEGESKNPSSPTFPSTIISRDLVERPSPKTTSAPDPNDFSEESHQREIAMEYQRHRMKRIHAQDRAFVGDGEDDNYGEMITSGKGRGSEGASGEKISRFKAARLNR
ncbi:uncharacterized protein PV06_05825 [Exophiala oligosperma]|uniref:DUF3835 domain-containing protein n=1 Tax=Exophiala oligosperma TaxID=215243 RepID=A0A0D2AQM4_9EURO|nr:uncharacterized protein PV06_05825 [Exophiala oligosperma]KIW42261.1 hypothetical protein PV06_05825 [Exophiala oligosperma]